MDRLLQDLRYALRTLRRSPAFTTASVLTLAVAIGATTAIFSVINGVLLHPLAYPDEGELAMVWLDNQRIGVRKDVHSYPNYADWRERTEAFRELAAYQPGAANLTGDFEPARSSGRRSRRRSGYGKAGARCGCG